MRAWLLTENTDLAADIIAGAAAAAVVVLLGLCGRAAAYAC
jgi:hypothetical protein